MASFDDDSGNETFHTSNCSLDALASLSLNDTITLPAHSTVATGVISEIHIKDLDRFRTCEIQLYKGISFHSGDDIRGIYPVFRFVYGRVSKEPVTLRKKTSVGSARFSLVNTGNNAHCHEIFGPLIAFERKITRQGPRFRAFSRWGDPLENGYRVWTRMLRHFRIDLNGVDYFSLNDVDNLLDGWCQQAKDYFEKCTKLSLLAPKFEELNQRLSQERVHMAELIRLRGSICQNPQVSKLVKGLVELKLRWAWCTVDRSEEMVMNTASLESELKAIPAKVEPRTSPTGEGDAGGDATDSSSSIRSGDMKKCIPHLQATLDEIVANYTDEWYISSYYAEAICPRENSGLLETDTMQKTSSESNKLWQKLNHLKGLRRYEEAVEYLNAFDTSADKLRAIVVELYQCKQEIDMEDQRRSQLEKQASDNFNAYLGVHHWQGELAFAGGGEALLIRCGEANGVLEDISVLEPKLQQYVKVLLQLAIRDLSTSAFVVYDEIDMCVDLTLRKSLWQAVVARANPERSTVILSDTNIGQAEVELWSTKAHICYHNE